MKGLRHIAFDGLRRTPQKSLGIYALLVLAASLISAVTLLVPMIWQDSVHQVESMSGKWHGAFVQPLTKAQVAQLEEAPEVRSLSLATPVKIASIASLDRPYLLHTNYNATYWENVFPADTILAEGRLPMQSDEIMVSQQMMRTEGLQLGDAILLTPGQRFTSEGEALAAKSVLNPAETFQSTDISHTKKIVGVGNAKMSIPSSKPYYDCFGFFQDGAFRHEERFFANIELHRPTSAFEIMPQLAEQLGFHPTHSEDPEVFSYNYDLLNHYGVIPPSVKDKGFLEILKYSFNSILTVFLIAVVCAFFFVLITTAFKAWHIERLRYWGLLRSIGATPAQIRRTIFWESFLLALPSAFIGVIIGFALNRLLVFQLFQLSAQEGSLASHSIREASDRILSYLSLPALFLAGFLAFLTILLANMRVAQRLARQPTLFFLKNLPEKSQGVYKKRREPRSKGRKRIQWQLPQQSLRYHRHYFRSARLAFTLSFLLLFVMSLYLANVFATNEKYFNDLSLKPQINFSHYSGELLGNSIRQDILALPGIENYMENRQLQVSIMLPKSAEGEEYHSRGGLASFLDSPHYLQDEGDSWRLSLMLYALPQDLFDAYCTEATISPVSKGGDATPVVLYNYMAEPLTAPGASLSTNQVLVTNLQPGDTLQGQENLFEDEAGKKSFQLEVVALTDQLPYAFDTTTSATSLKAIVPYAIFDHLAQGFSPDKEMRSHNTTLRLRVDPDQEGVLYEKINSLLEKEFSESDYSLTSVEAMRAESHRTLQFMFKVSQLISGFFALFGLISAFATIRQSMLLRQHDFAMLRSVGIDPQGLLGILMREGFLFFILPFTNALLLSTLFGILILLLNKIPPFLLLRFMPWHVLLFFTLGVFLVLMGSYYLNLRSFIKKPIASQLRSDILQ